MKALSLFSGCGGDTLGMEQAGIKVEYFSELKKVFQNTHTENFKDSKLIGGDINKIPDEKFSELEGKIDVIFGGFPCQSFSHGGKKDPKDPRGQLYLQFVRAARLIQPKYIIGENVKGLLTRVTPQGEKFIDVILKAFKDIGYTCHVKVFKVSDFGVPQTRERLIIVGKKGGDWIPKWPQKTKENTLKNVLKFDMRGTLEVPQELFTEAEVPDDIILKGSSQPSGTPHPYLVDRANVRGVTYNDKLYSTYAFSFGKRKSPVHCEIVDPNKMSKTIICTYDHQPRLFVAQQVKEKKYLRCLTIDELKEIQGFPRDYKLCGTDKEQIIQLGNAVPPALVREVCKEMILTN